MSSQLCRTITSCYWKFVFAEAEAGQVQGEKKVHTTHILFFSSPCFLCSA